MSDASSSETPGPDSCGYDTNSCTDEEAKFYQVMHEGLQGDVIRDVTCDFFDASLGTQHGVSASGQAVVMLVATPEVAEAVKNALDHWQAHACQLSIEMGMFLLHLIGGHFGELDLPK